MIVQCSEVLVLLCGLNESSHYSLVCVGVASVRNSIELSFRPSLQHSTYSIVCVCSISNINTVEQKLRTPNVRAKSYTACRMS